jgi:hypothetical protein
MNPSFRNKISIFVLVISLLLLNFGCEFKKGYANTPEGVTRKLFDALQENDSNKYLDSILPTARQLPNFFFYRQLIQGIMGVVGLGQMEAAKPRISFSSLEIKELDNDGKTSRVQVGGKVRDLNFAIEQDFNTVVLVVKTQDGWLCSVSGDVQSELSNTLPTQSPSPKQEVHLPDTLTITGAAGGQWELIPEMITLDNYSSSRDGYRKVIFSYSIFNMTDNILLYDLPAYDNPKIKLVDSRGFEYNMTYQPLEQNEGVFYIPPYFFTYWYALGEVPDNSRGFTLELQSDVSLIKLNVDDTKETNFPVNGELYALINQNYGSDKTIEIPDLGIVTLTSTTNDKNTKTLNLTVKIKNLYGHDLVYLKNFEFEFKDAGVMRIPEVVGNSEIIIVPGRETTIELSLSSFYDDIKDCKLVTVFIIGNSDGSSNHKIFYTVHQPQ